MLKYGREGHPLDYTNRFSGSVSTHQTRSRQESNCTSRVGNPSPGGRSLCPPWMHETQFPPGVWSSSRSLGTWVESSRETRNPAHSTRDSLLPPAFSSGLTLLESGDVCPFSRAFAQPPPARPADLGWFWVSPANGVNPGDPTHCPAWWEEEQDWRWEVMDHPHPHQPACPSQGYGL